MKKMAIFAALLVASACFATDIPSPSTPKILIDNGAGGAEPVSSSNPLPTSITSGNVTLTGTLPLQYWNVGAPSISTGTALSTTAETSLTSLTGTLSANNYVEVQANAKVHYAKSGTATATMQNLAYLSAGEVRGWRVGTSTFDLSFIADSAAVASLAINVYTLH